MRVIPDIGPLGFDGGINSAILRYAGAPDTDPTSIQSPSVIPLIESNLNVRSVIIRCVMRYLFSYQVLNPVPVVSRQKVTRYMVVGLTNNVARRTITWRCGRGI